MSTKTKLPDGWEKLINPDYLKSSLVQCSLYLSAYEILKSSIMNRLRDFMAIPDDLKLNELGQFESKMSPTYKNEVFSLYKKDEFHACCLWFKKNEAIDQIDIESIQLIRQHRNKIAHELPTFLSLNSREVDVELLNQLVEVVKKVDLWWIKNIEIPVNPEFDNIELSAKDWENTIGGNSLVLSLLLSLFDGNDSFLKQFHGDMINAFDSQSKG